MIYVARPFRFNRGGGLPQLSFAVAIYDVDAAIAQDPYVVAHCEDAVRDAGGLLVQHRPLPVNTVAGHTLFGSSLQIVGSIGAANPDDPVIDYWPPGTKPGYTIAGIEPDHLRFPPTARAYDYYVSATGRTFQLRPREGTGALSGDLPPPPPLPTGRMIVRPPDPVDPVFEALQQRQRRGLQEYHQYCLDKLR